MIVPAVLFGVAALGLFIDASANSTVVAAENPTTATVAPAPEALSTTTTTRDTWNQAGSTKRR